MYTLSYLKGTAVDWFEPGLLSTTETTSLALQLGKI